MTEQQAVGASLPPISPQVRQALSYLRTAVGTKRCTVTWNRTGTDLDLIGGNAGQWTTEAIYGDLGDFRVDVPDAPIKEPYLRYQFFGQDLQIDAGGRILGIADRLAPARQPVGAGSQPVGMIGVMTVFSILSVIWTLIHTRVTVQLPGRIMVDLQLAENALSVTFHDPKPTLRVVCGIQFDVAPTSLLLQEKVATLYYRGPLGFARDKQWTWE